MAYVDVSELQRVLGIASPTAAELDAMNRVLEDAAADIDWDLGYTAESPAPSPPPAVVVDVNLDRAAELWAFQTRATAGIIVLPGVDAVPLFPPRDTWYRHHLRLTKVRTEFAIG